MAQLAERSPTIPEDPGSNPVIGNFYLNIYLLLTVCRKDENKEKEAENGPFFLKVETPLLRGAIYAWGTRDENVCCELVLKGFVQLLSCENIIPLFLIPAENH